MKIQYEDLLKFLNLQPSIEELSNKLFQLGHEHEIEGNIFIMELTPNRGDCLSLLGLARDLYVFFGRSNNIEIYDGQVDELEIGFINLVPQDCPKISFLEIEIEEKPSEYKTYLENFYKYIGNNKSNFFTDISNYISYELGQPTHCFDSRLIKDELYLKNKNCSKEEFVTLLDRKILLSDRNLVFTSSDKVISLAGVMGGLSTACSSDTKKVLVECAFFNPESIIGTAIKYNLISDAAHKFERGVDSSIQEFALRRFIKIVEDHTRIKKASIKTFTSIDHNYVSIPIDVDKINKILGINLNTNEYINYLIDLGFSVTDAIKVPSFRHDVKSQNDLAEEIARVIGYDQIESTPIQLKNKFKSKTHDKLKIIESFLINNGFNQVINYPFSSNNTNESINIDNSLDSNKANFRLNLQESLLSNLIYNENRQKDSIKLFEISDIYTKTPEISYQKKLGIIVSGRVGHDHESFQKKLDKKYLDGLMNDKKSSHIFNIEEISRASLNSKKKDKIFYIEEYVTDIPDDFYDNKKCNLSDFNFTKYEPISEYPSSYRDFSFLISDLHKVDEVINMLENTKDIIIKDSFLFDFYKDTNKNSVKIGYRFIFQSHQKTLSDTEINIKLKQILSPILKLDGVIIPGL